MTLLDYAIIVSYMIGIVGVGLLSKGKDDSADEYFAANGRMSGWLNTAIVGLSITATYFSGLSFVAVPSIIISDGLKVTFMLVSLPIASWIVCGWFLPRYRSLQVSQPYEMISRHIGHRTRLVTSALFVSLRMGWMAALLYAPTLLLLATMRLEEGWLWPLILMMGLSSTFYTVLGGLKSVLITDAIQMLIVIGSLAVAVGVGVWQLPADPGQWLRILTAEGKFTLPSLSLDPTERFTAISILLAVTAMNLGNYIGDQMSLQRYIAMRDLAEAQRSFRINLWGVAITLSLLYCLGLVILIWNSVHGTPPADRTADQIFPRFVAVALPSGVCGLMVAAILAATMDSIASGINSLAGSITIDFVQPRFTHLSERSLVKIGKIISLVVGVVATVVAGFLSRIGSIFDTTQTILGVFLGPILAVVLLSMQRRRVNEARVLWAIPISCGCGFALSFTPVQSIWTTFVGCTTCLLIGWPYGAPLRADPAQTTGLGPNESALPRVPESRS